LSQGIAVSVVGVVGIDWSDPAGKSQDGSTLFPAGGDSYIYVLHSQLSQILGDAVHNGNWPVTRARGVPHPERASNVYTAKDLMTEKRLHNSELDLPLFRT